MHAWERMLKRKEQPLDIIRYGRSWPLVVEETLMNDFAVFPAPNGNLGHLRLIAVLERYVHIPLRKADVSICSRSFDAAIVPRRRERRRTPVRTCDWFLCRYVAHHCFPASRRRLHRIVQKLQAPCPREPCYSVPGRARQYPFSVLKKVYS